MERALNIGYQIDPVWKLLLYRVKNVMKIIGGRIFFLLLFFTTIRVMAPLKNEPILWDR